MDAQEQRADRDVDPHLQEVEDGCGCTEVWEHLSEQRDDDSDDSGADAEPSNSRP